MSTEDTVPSVSPRSSTPQVLTPNDSLNSLAFEEMSESSADFKTDNESNVEKVFLTGTADTNYFTVAKPMDSPPNVNLEEISAALDLLLEHGILPPENLKDSVIHLISRKRVEALCDSDYDRAEMLDKSLFNLVKTTESMTLLSESERKERDYNQRMKGLHERIENIKEDWKTKLENYKTELEHKLMELDSLNEQEIRDFKKKWTSEENMRAFSKPSYKLLQLRYMEKKSALSRRYEHAKETKKIADKLQEEEERQQQSQYEEKMAVEYRKLLDKQERKKARITEKYEKLAEEATISKDRQLAAVKSVVNQTRVKNTTMHTKKSALFQRPPIASLINLESSPQSALQTPRTASKLNQYRSDKKATLRLSPVSEDTLKKIATSPLRSPKASTRGSSFPSLKNVSHL